MSANYERNQCVVRECLWVTGSPGDVPEMTAPIGESLFFKNQRIESKRKIRNLKRQEDQSHCKVKMNVHSLLPVVLWHTHRDKSRSRRSSTLKTHRRQVGNLRIPDSSSLDISTLTCCCLRSVRMVFFISRQSPGNHFKCAAHCDLCKPHFCEATSYLCFWISNSVIQLNILKHRTFLNPRE